MRWVLYERDNDLYIHNKERPLMKPESGLRVCARSMYLHTTDVTN